MPVKHEVIEYYRTLVRDDYEANDRIEKRLKEVGWGSFTQYVSALFFAAIDLRFDGKYDRAAVIRFVAEMRAELADTHIEIEQAVGERVVSAVLDPSIELNADAEQLVQIQTYGMYKALKEANLTDDELDEILKEAAELSED